jgi:DUF971 family protein
VALIPKTLQPIGEELAIVWSDGAETYLKLSDLRRLCPCAECSGERDLLGRLAKPPAKPLTSASFQLVGTAPVGGYAVQLFWADGHSDGLFVYSKLREWGENPPELPKLTVTTLLPTRPS